MFRSLVPICLLILIFGFITGDSIAQTTVYIVRHAEKDLKNSSDRDPALSLEGQDRAKDLSTYLYSKRMLAVYATSTRRAKDTAYPTAYGRGLDIQTYDPAAPKELASAILRQHKGGAVLFVGHSNTVLELVEAFGIKRPIPAISEDEYSYIFELQVQDNAVRLLTSQYGRLKPKLE